ncbi:hypothetical protein HNY73_004398 [Argiope bruennichi]|uniref:Uncharacterized protein n=1 Tax=Argiope bruennichi TaxID=94029 RepID=A0A8T0FT41_ARGBR|nr:hypothetical protein HNY73_004398 [Argiope bruennichi]
MYTHTSTPPSPTSQHRHYPRRHHQPQKPNLIHSFIHYPRPPSPNLKNPPHTHSFITHAAITNLKTPPHTHSFIHYPPPPSPTSKTPPHTHIHSFIHSPRQNHQPQKPQPHTHSFITHARITNLKNPTSHTFIHYPRQNHQPQNLTSPQALPTPPTFTQETTTKPPKPQLKRSLPTPSTLSSIHGSRKIHTPTPSLVHNSRTYKHIIPLTPTVNTQHYVQYPISLLVNQDNVLSITHGEVACILHGIDFLKSTKLSLHLLPKETLHKLDSTPTPTPKTKYINFIL